ncbi:hypothetical protein GGTG_01360 [Gaeumannomyces tritici R3-111a-1]|uniref:Uncharacterized protein n=1 Tax=Gaeumannomyces tritici (strain R3-111a-1) TaxID=644352 RepID=J3NJC8_GAET3|nr:hypothetical protein GGTG_01360 [Gaeumannomyces tritici R3-111a-1]EJT81379.1 hypothetical protein GGTG_01360 [Gaeumannomyces tritici R3-111a-1]
MPQARVRVALVAAAGPTRVSPATSCLSPSVLGLVSQAPRPLYPGAGPSYNRKDWDITTLAPTLKPELLHANGSCNPRRVPSPQSHCFRRPPSALSVYTTVPTFLCGCHLPSPAPAFRNRDPRPQAQLTSTAPHSIGTTDPSNRPPSTGSPGIVSRLPRNDTSAPAYPLDNPKPSPPSIDDMHD